MAVDAGAITDHPPESGTLSERAKPYTARAVLVGTSEGYSIRCTASQLLLTESGWVCSDSSIKKRARLVGYSHRAVDAPLPSSRAASGRLALTHVASRVTEWLESVIVTSQLHPDGVVLSCRTPADASRVQLALIGDQILCRTHDGRHLVLHQPHAGTYCRLHGAMLTEYDREYLQQGSLMAEPVVGRDLARRLAMLLSDQIPEREMMPPVIADRAQDLSSQIRAGDITCAEAGEMAELMRQLPQVDWLRRVQLLELLTECSRPAVHVEITRVSPCDRLELVEMSDEQVFTADGWVCRGSRR